jgi:hypothetical protein
MDSAKNTRTATAVEWFASQMTANYWSDEEFNSIIEHAKQIEKEQIMRAFTKGQEKESIMGFYDRGKEYYNETYGK